MARGPYNVPFGIGDNRVGGGNPNTDSYLGALLCKILPDHGRCNAVEGIEPDIKLPGIYEPYKMQEKNNPTALAWDTIQAVPF